MRPAQHYADRLLGATLTSVTGVVRYSWGSYVIHPRSAADLSFGAPGTAAPPPPPAVPGCIERGMDFYGGAGCGYAPLLAIADDSQAEDMMNWWDGMRIYSPLLQRPEDCQALCAEQRSCDYWSFEVEGQLHLCYLKAQYEDDPACNAYAEWDPASCGGGTGDCASGPAFCDEQLVVKTCERSVSRNVGTNGGISFRIDQAGAWQTLDNPGDDREAGQTDTYKVGLAGSLVEVRADSSDGWCIESMSYGGVEVALSCQGGALWLDSPCTSPTYGSPELPCLTSLSFDPRTGMSNVCTPAPPWPPNEAPSPPPPPEPSPPPPKSPATGLLFPTFSVASNANCAEENTADGSMYLTSSDLELPFDGATRQLVGIVFPAVELSASSTIANTHLVRAPRGVRGGGRGLAPDATCSRAPGVDSATDGARAARRCRSSTSTRCESYQPSR
jgi:hypothetical protein